MSLFRPLFTLALGASLVAACTQNDDPDGAKQLLAKINEGAGYRAWRRAPGFPARTPSFTAHANAVEVFVNAPLGAALDGPSAITSWPEGSIIVSASYMRTPNA